MNKATHTTKAGHLYRIVPRKGSSMYGFFNTGVEFWDKHQNKWLPSIMSKSELIEL